MNIESELNESSGGAYEIFLDKEKVYSRLQTGLFPNEDNLINMIKSKI